MKAILLAAGLGRRLQKLAGGRPKCLLQFGGKSLLRRHVENLNGQGIERIVIVTGHGRERIAAELEDLASRAPIKIIVNPDYARGSVVSLHCAGAELADGADSVLMDADVLYDPGVLGRLFNTKHDNCFLLDRDFESGDEPVKLCVANNSLVEFRKKIDKNLTFDYQGESVGFFRFEAGMSARLAARAREYIVAGRLDEPYEEAIRGLLVDAPDQFGFEDITGQAWIEIDFPEDVARAERDIAGRIAL